MVRYASIFAKNTVHWYGTPFLYRYGTLVQYASKIELKYDTLVWYGSRCEVRGKQIVNVPYRTAILGPWPPIYDMLELHHFAQLTIQLRHFSCKKNIFWIKLLPPPPPLAKSWLHAYLRVCRGVEM